MGRRCEEASMANSISLSPDNGSLWLSDGIAADPTLAPGLLFQSRSWKTSHSRNYAQSRSALGAKLLKLSLLSGFFLIFPTFFLEQEIHLECIGQGPVVYVSPREINFGAIRVLKDNTKSFRLSNQSGIPAPFRAEMVSVCGAVFQRKRLVSSSP